MFKRGQIPWNKGLKGFGKWSKTKGFKFSEETKNRMKLSAKRGIKNHMWKGNKVGKLAIHHWLERNFGKLRKCEICGDVNAKHYDWANKDHKYKRKRKDYLRLCRSCHRKYDYKFNNYKPK